MKQIGGGPRDAAAALGLFFAGLIYGAAGRAPVSSFLILLPVSASINRPLRELFFPVYIKEAYSWYLRPIPRLILRFLHERFGLDPTPYHWMGGALAGLLAASAFLCLLSITGRRLPSFVAAVLTLLTPAVAYDSFYASELDYFGAAFMLIALAAFVRAGRGRSLPAEAAFYAAMTVSILIKETTAVFLFILLSAWVLSRRLGGERAERGSLVKLGAAAAFLAVYFFSFLFTDRNVKNDAATPGFVYFVVRHNLLQFVYLMGFSGVCALTVGGWEAFRLRKKEAASGFPAFALAGLWLFCLATPVIVTFSFYEAVYYSRSPQMEILPALLLSGLAGFLFSRRAVGRFFSLFILGTLAVGVAVPILVPFSREDVGSKMYIPCAPFLAFMALEGIERAWKSARRMRPLPGFAHRAAVGGVCLCVAWGYLMAPGALFRELRAFSEAEQEAKTALAGLDFDGRQALFFTDFVNFVTPSDLGVFDERIRFAAVGFLNHHGENGETEDLRFELCRKVGLMEMRGASGWLRDLYIYDVTKRSLLEGGLKKNLKGNFAYTERNSYFYLQKHPDLPSQHWAMGLVPASQKTFLSGRTDLERFLDANARTVHESDRDVSIPFRWLEDLPARLAAGLGAAQPVRFQDRVYVVDRAKLACDS